jgi:oxygen-independent coproporphyrinogen-3 oxidase
MTEVSQEKTGLGNYFVANYPPFSFWKPEHLDAARAALNAPPDPSTPLGLYLHIPFCRKRCKFCYFRVYTDKNARDVDTYLDALTREVDIYRALPCVGGRAFQFVYFGGGTPSYLSANQLRQLVERLRQSITWKDAAEVTFECEPGTLQHHKLETLKEIGVTRLSLGIENFDDAILEANGRAHLSAEIHRAYGWARDVGFDQINIDLIAGMVGENWDKWKETVKKTIELGSESVTIYQMELPFNTVFSEELRHRDNGGRTALTMESSSETPHAPVADWPTKREWVRYAFDELAKAGYEVSSAYTMVKNCQTCRFVYRDSLWHGADMFGTGVASFGHVNGVHMQNVDTWEKYITLLDKGELPLGRAHPVTGKESLVREFILQLKTGRIEAAYFKQKFGVDPMMEFREPLNELANAGHLYRENGTVRLTDDGLMQIDRHLPTFFLPEHRGARYT